MKKVINYEFNLGIFNIFERKNEVFFTIRIHEIFIKMYVKMIYRESLGYALFVRWTTLRLFRFFFKLHNISKYIKDCS